MEIKMVEVYSDATNAAILRHPLRKFPGILVQGDTLYSMKKRVERVFDELDEKKDEEAYYEMKDIHDWLTGLVQHYKSTLKEHDLDLPFFDP